jgi:hypothetical protein
MLICFSKIASLLSIVGTIIRDINEEYHKLQIFIWIRMMVF